VNSLPHAFSVVWIQHTARAKASRPPNPLHRAQRPSHVPRLWPVGPSLHHCAGEHGPTKLRAEGPSVPLQALVSSEEEARYDCQWQRSNPTSNPNPANCLPPLHTHTHLHTHLPNCLRIAIARACKDHGLLQAKAWHLDDHAGQVCSTTDGYILSNCSGPSRAPALADK
jgi:hypothetical protein